MACRLTATPALEEECDSPRLEPSEVGRHEAEVAQNDEKEDEEQRENAFGHEALSWPADRFRGARSHGGPVRSHDAGDRRRSGDVAPRSWRKAARRGVRASERSAPEGAQALAAR